MRSFLVSILSLIAVTISAAVVWRRPGATFGDEFGAWLLCIYVAFPLIALATGVVSAFDRLKLAVVAIVASMLVVGVIGSVALAFGADMLFDSEGSFAFAGYLLLVIVIYLLGLLVGRLATLWKY